MSSEPENKRPLSLAAIEAAVAEMLEGGECSIADEHGGKVYRITPTKIGQRKNKSATIEQINQSIERSGLELDEEKKKRIYRRADQLPDPSRSPQDSANRTTKQLAVRIDPERMELFNELAAHFGSKREAFERAIDLLKMDVAEDEGPSPKNG